MTGKAAAQNSFKLVWLEALHSAAQPSLRENIQAYLWYCVTRSNSGLSGVVDGVTDGRVFRRPIEVPHSICRWDPPLSAALYAPRSAATPSAAGIRHCLLPCRRPRSATTPSAARISHCLLPCRRPGVQPRHLPLGSATVCCLVGAQECNHAICR
jgi:hypothetical protein